MDKVWLVTGAAGFLGANAGAWLNQRAVTVGQSRYHLISHLFHHHRRLDLRDPDGCRKIITQVQPDVILHSAAISGHQTCADDPEQARSVNVEATRHLSQQAAEIGAKFVYISTDAVFDGDSGGYAETDLPNPFSLYGETKLQGERVVLESGARSLIVRTNFFGWSSLGQGSVLEFFVNSLREGRLVKGYPDVVVTSMYVRTLLQNIWDLVAADFSGLIHVASNDAMSKFAFGVSVAQEFSLDHTLISTAAAQGASGDSARSRNLSLNTGLLSEILQRKPQSQLAGIAQARREEVMMRKRFRGP